MKRLSLILVLWLLVLAIGLGGLFSGQSALMGFCFVAWTPLVFMLGFAAKAANIRIAIGSDAPQPRTTQLDRQDVQRRERRVS